MGVPRARRQCAPCASRALASGLPPVSTKDTAGASKGLEWGLRILLKSRCDSPDFDGYTVVKDEDLSISRRYKSIGE